MDRGRPATLPEIADEVVRFLRERGPLGDEELLSALAAAGVDLGTRPADTLDGVLHDEELPEVACLADGRHAHLPALLEGRVFTHRLTAEESEHDAVFVQPDLAPLSMLADDETNLLPIAGGGAVREVLAGFDPDDELLAERGITDDFIGDVLMWLLPPGALSGTAAAAGDLVGFWWSHGELRLGPVELEPETPGSLEARFVDVVGGADEPVDPLPVDVAVTTLIADDPAAFVEPMAPLGDLVERAGLVREDELLGSPGFSFERWRGEKRLAEIARLHRLDEDQALTVLALLGMHRAVVAQVEEFESGPTAGPESTPGPGDGDRDEDAREPAELPGPDGPTADWAKVESALLVFLADAPVAEAFFSEAVGIGTRGATAVGVLAETLATRAPAGAQPALAWLQASAMERLGDVDGAEAELERALRLDGGFAPAACDLATFTSDRGDLDRTLSLLRRGGVPPDDPLLVLLQRIRPAAPSGVGRNDRCWCGSGRKYKQCHLGREAPPLEDRGGWLINKAATFAGRGPWRTEVLEAARVRSLWREDPLALLEALDDPLVMDVVLFEGGAFADFIARRGHLLPEDERMMADQWLLADRSIFDIESVRPGESVSVRDIRTGDRHVVRERAASRQLRPGELVCTRVVPVGDTVQFMGGVEPVALNQRDELVALLDGEPDPLDVIEFLSRRLAPPVLHNTEGQDLVMCEIEMAVGRDIAPALTERFSDPDGDPPTWHQHVTTHGMERIRATFVLDGGHLRIDTNSAERGDDAIALVRDLDPEASVVVDRRTPMGDLREAMSRAGEPSGPAPASLLEDPPPELRAALAEQVRAWEDQWIDESIPALDGLTPREAAADPTRREDLDRLLTSFGPATEFGMDQVRLRQKLGLER